MITLYNQDTTIEQSPNVEEHTLFSAVFSLKATPYTDLAMHAQFSKKFKSLKFSCGGIPPGPQRNYVLHVYYLSENILLHLWVAID